MRRVEARMRSIRPSRSLRVARRLRRLAERRPRALLLALIALAALAGLLASRLSFDGSYYALLPRDAPFVREADAVREATGGNRQLVVVIEGADRDARRRFARELASGIARLPEVRFADADLGLEALAEHRAWLLGVDALDRLIDATRHALDATSAAVDPLGLSLDAGEDEQAAIAAWSEVAALAAEAPASGSLESRDGLRTFVLVTPNVRVMDVRGTAALLDGIAREAERLRAGERGVAVRFAGKFVLVREQHATMQRDLARASVLALVLSIALIALFTRRLPAPLVIGAAAALGIVLTLALAALALGQLNILSGLVAPFLAGLGVDYGVHLVMRFREERDAMGRPVGLALERAIAGTLSPSLIAALTTAAAFGSLCSSQLRGLVELGALAAVGVPLTLVATYAVVPPLLVLAERSSWLAPAPRPRSAPRARAVRGLERHRPRARLALATTVTLVLGAIAIVGALRADRISLENDYRLLTSERASRLFASVDEDLPFRFDPTVIVVDDLEAARRVHAIVAERGAAGSIVSAADLVADGDDARAERILALRALLERPVLDLAASTRPELVAALERSRAAVRAPPPTLADLPPPLARRLLTRDGRLVVLMWSRDRIESDAQALAWEAEVDVVRAALSAEGLRATISTEALMPAWVHRMLTADAPRIIAGCALVVALLVLVHLRSLARAALVLGALAVSMLGLLALMHAMGLSLDTFNLIVLPCAVGIGIDDLVHVEHRYREAGRGSIARVLRHTGAGVFLTTSTTMAGFGSLLVAEHRGLASVGELALVAFSLVLACSLLLLPSLVVLAEHARGRRASAA